MATISLATDTGTVRPSRNKVKMPYIVEATVDLAVAATTKGSAIAQGDVIEALNVPAKTVVMAAGIEVITAMTGTSTDATIDVGFTGGDVDNFVDGFDLDGASAGALSGNGVQEPIVVSTADTVDILVATQTGTITGGKVRIWAVVADIDGVDAPGLATLGS